MKAGQFDMKAREVYSRYYKRRNPLVRTPFTIFNKICSDLQNANATGQSFASIARSNQVKPSKVEGIAKWLHVESGSPFGRLVSMAKRAGNGKAIPREVMIEYLKFRHNGCSIAEAAGKSGISTHAARGWEIRNVNQYMRSGLETTSRNLARRHPMTEAIVSMLKVMDQSKKWSGVPRYSAYAVADALGIDSGIVHKLSFRVRSPSQRAVVKERYDNSTKEEKYLILEEAKIRAKRTLHELEQKHYVPYPLLSPVKKIELRNAVTKFLSDMWLPDFVVGGKQEQELRRSLQRAFMKISESENPSMKESLANYMGTNIEAVEDIINIINGNQKGWKILVQNKITVWVNPDLPKIIQ